MWLFHALIPVNIYLRNPRSQGKNRCKTKPNLSKHNRNFLGRTVSVCCHYGLCFVILWFACWCQFVFSFLWSARSLDETFNTLRPRQNIPALVQIMAWRRPGDKPLSEPMMISLPTHICVTRPQWVKIPPWLLPTKLILVPFCGRFSCCTAGAMSWNSIVSVTTTRFKSRI